MLPRLALENDVIEILKVEPFQKCTNYLVDLQKINPIIRKHLLLGLSQIYY